MSYFRTLFLNLISAWNKFWFDSQSDSQLLCLSVFRVFFYAVMLFFYTSRAFDVELFYSENGLLPSWHRENMELFRFHPTILDGMKSIPLLHSLHTLFLLFLFSCMVGFYTRISTIAAFILHMMFLNRNMSVMFGVDMIATFYLLYMCFARSNVYFSIDAKLARAPAVNSLTSHISWRLMQIQLCVIYAFSGMEKLKGTRWWDGSALFDVLSIGNMQRWDMSFLAHVPILLAANVYVVLFWEIYFPVLIWNKKLKNPMLLMGVFLHIGIYLFMNLPTFGFMMIALYIPFLERADLANILRKARILVRSHY
jgi:hypothetical protein